MLLAVAVSVIVGSFVPFGSTILYPFTLLATWVHEMGHGLAAIAVGGRFDHLEIFASAGGLAYTHHGPGWPAAIVSLGGLLAPPVVGALMLVIARGPRRAQAVLVVLSIALVVSLAVWVRSITGFIAVPLIAAFILVFVRWGSPRERMFAAQFLALRLAADTLGRGIHYLWSDQAKVAGKVSPSDIANVATALGGPRAFYSAIVTAVCVLILAVGVFAAWRRAR